MKDPDIGWLRYGPFAPREIEQIREALKGANIAFEERLDHEGYAQAEVSWSRARGAHGRMFDPRFVYIDLIDSDVPRIPPMLEKMGFYDKHPNEPDFSRQEYLCAKCDHESDSPGHCPRHEEKLLTFDQWVETQGKSRDVPRIFWAFLFFGLLWLAWWYGSLHPRQY